MQRNNWRAGLFTIGVVAAAFTTFPQQFNRDKPQPNILKQTDISVGSSVEAKLPRMAAIESSHENVLAMFDLPAPFVLQDNRRETTDSEPLPDFSAIETVAEKKQAFIDFVLPLVEQENRKILQNRSDLEDLRRRFSLNSTASQSELVFVASLCEQYHMEFSGILSVRLLDRLLERVDVIPASLVLSQAATESGWGTSRLAVKKNNLFGHFGFVAAGEHGHKSSQTRYRPVSFESPSHAIERYFSNLNTHDAYRDFRELRSQLRRQNRALTGLALVSELQAYSSRGEAYVRQIARVIRANGFADFDDVTRYL